MNKQANKSRKADREKKSSCEVLPLFSWTGTKRASHNTPLFFLYGRERDADQERDTCLFIVSKKAAFVDVSIAEGGAEQLQQQEEEEERR